MGEPCSTLRLMPYPPCGDGRPGSWDRGQREGAAKIIPCPLPIREQSAFTAKLTVKMLDRYLSHTEMESQILRGAQGCSSFFAGRKPAATVSLSHIYAPSFVVP
jgi:hypothetical protein